MENLMANITGSLIGDTIICSNKPVSLAAAYKGDHPLYFQFSLDGVVVKASSRDSILNLPSINNGQTISILLNDSVSGEQLLRNVIFTVNPLPTLAAISPITVCAPNTANIVQVPQAGYTFTYYQSDKTTIVVNPISVSTSGTYYITKTNNVTGCVSAFTPIVVAINPQPVIAPLSPIIVCAPNTVNIVQAPQAGYTFSYYQSDKTTVVVNPMSVSTSGTYYITKTNNVTGCVSAFTPIVVTINPQPVISPLSSIIVCAPNTVNIVQAPQAGYTFAYYQSDQSTIISDPTALTSSGTYYITKTNNVTGCVSAFTPIVVTINPQPVISPIAPITACAPNAVNITLPPQAGFTFTYYQPDQTTVIADPTALSASGTYYITKTDNITGCVSPFTPVAVTINIQPTINPIAPISNCAPVVTANIIQSPQIGYTFAYYQADQNTVVATPSTVTASGIFYVTKTDNTTGCVSAFTPVFVSLNPKPAFTPNAPAIACTPNAADIVQAPQTGFSYNYYKSDMSTVVPRPDSITVSDTYYITKTNNTTTCVSNFAPVTATVVTSPVAFAGPDVVICDGSTVKLGQGTVANVNYLWSPTVNLSSSTISNPTATVVENITYILTASLKTYPQCISKDTINIRDSKLPTQYNVLGGGSYCTGLFPSNTYVEMTTYDANVSYALFLNGTQFSLWETGDGTAPITWLDLYKGVYTVEGENTDNCIQTMANSINIQQNTLPTASISASKPVICPGDSMNVTFQFYGVPPFTAIYQNRYGFSYTINSPTSIYTISVAPLTADTFSITTVTDARCQNIYDVASRPSVPINVGQPIVAKINLPNDFKGVCLGSIIPLSAAYNATPNLHYKWSTGDTTQIINVAPTDTTNYILQVSDNGGCMKTDTVQVIVYPLPVVDFQGLDAQTNVCTNQDPIQLTGTPSGGIFTGPNVVGSTYYPSADMANGMDSVTYTYTDLNGCVNKKTKYYYINPYPTVNWFVPEEVGPPTPYQSSYTFCRFFNDSLEVQGIPATSSGVWTLYTDVPGPAVIIPLGNGAAYIKNCLPGTYHLRYTYTDNKGCTNSMMKEITILSNYPDVLDLGNIIIPQGDTLCSRDTLDLIESTRVDGYFQLNNPALIVSQDSLSGQLWINPSKGNSGEYTVMFFKIDGQSCQHYTYKTFYIQSPINMLPLTIPKTYCVTDPRVSFKFQSANPVTGTVYIIKNGNDTIINRVPDTTSLYFDPSWGVGSYVIKYNYFDKYCNSTYSFPITVNPLPVINMNLPKRDYCYGDIVTLNALPSGGFYSCDNNNLGLVNNVFTTAVAGTGTHTIYYKYISPLGCQNSDSIVIYVRGQKDGDMKILNLSAEYCQNSGSVTIAGYPTENGVPFFQPAVYLTDLGNGQAIIDLSKTNYNSVNPVTFSFKEYYYDVYNKLDSCVTSTSQSFKIISESADFFGYNDQDTICTTIDSLMLIGNKTQNSSFQFSLVNNPALKNISNGQAVLYPNQLSQGWYSITYNINYFEGSSIICSAQKIKSFYINPLNSFTPRIVCSGNNNAFQIDNSQVGVTYQIWINGVLSQSLIGNGGSILFAPISTEAHCQFYASRGSCVLSYSTDFHIYPLSVQINKTDITCTGLNNGQLVAVVKGGNNPTSVLWSSLSSSYSSTDLSITSLVPDSYTVVASDSIGCTATETTTLTDPIPVSLSIASQSTLLCNGASDGLAIVVGSGGRPPYKYTWVDINNNVVSSLGTISNVKAGFYTASVTDRNMCEASINVNIPESSAIQFQVTSIQNVLISGQKTGAININVTGSLPPYTYLWTGIGIDPLHKNDQNQQNLIAGKYFLSIEDANGCEKDTFVVVTQPEVLIVNAVVQNVSCFGTSTGSINLTVSGGKIPYTYSWTNGGTYSSTQEDAVGLPAGIYSVLVTDSAGMTYSNNYKIFTPPLLQVFSSGRTDTALVCYNQYNAVLEVLAQGGTPPYSYNWINGSVPVSSKTSPYLTGLSQGTYTVMVKDTNNCSVSTNFIITQPSQILITPTIVYPSCSAQKDASITLQVTGGVSPYDFYWGGLGVLPTSQNQTNIGVGNYSVLVTDANACEDSTNYTLTEPIQLTAELSGTTDICLGTAAELDFKLNTSRNWTIKYTDGTQIYTVNTTSAAVVQYQSPTQNTTYTLLSASDENNCFAILTGSLTVTVHEYPDIKLLKDTIQICQGQETSIPYILSGESPWNVRFTDATRVYQQSNISSGLDSLSVSPTVTDKYNLVSVSNNYCVTLKSDTVNVIVHPLSQLTVSQITPICTGDTTTIRLDLQGEAPWTVFYTEGSIDKAIQVLSTPYLLKISPGTSTIFSFNKVESAFGCQNSTFAQRLAIVNSSPAAAQVVTGLSQVCSGAQVVYFTPQIPFATDYDWTFPAGATIITGAGTNQVMVQYAQNTQSGTISVAGRNSCGEGPSAVLPIIVNNLAGDAGQIVMPDTLCQSQQFFYISVPSINNATEYDWTLPYGFVINQGAGTANILVSLNSDAIGGTVTVVGKNNCNQGAPSQKQVTIKFFPIVEAGPNADTNCKDSIQLNATNPSPYVGTWSIITGKGTFKNVNDPKTMITGLGFGTNKLLWEVSNSFCTKSDTVTISNDSPDQALPEIVGDYITCADTITLKANSPQYGIGHWDCVGGQGTIANPSSNITFVTNLGYGKNSFRWTISNGICENFAIVNIYSNSPKKYAFAGSNDTVLVPEYRLNASKPVNIEGGQWTVISGSGVLSNPNSYLTLVTNLSNGANTFRWTVFNQGCQAYAEVTIDYAIYPIASFAVDTVSGCAPFAPLITNSTMGQASFLWDFGDGTTSTAFDPSHVYKTPGQYTIKLTAIGTEKTDKDSIIIVVSQNPQAKFDILTDTVYIPNAQLRILDQSSLANDYLWYFGDGQTSTDKNPTHTYMEAGWYDISLKVTSLNHCVDSINVPNAVFVKSEGFIVFPNAFIPDKEFSNGGVYSLLERKNNVFYPIWEDVVEYQLHIFNRWGEEIFVSNDVNIGWDGYVKNKLCQMGVYVYKATGNFKNGKAFIKTGDVTLIQ
jgi:PKD repeat protein